MGSHRVEREGPVATLLFDRPPINSRDIAMHEEMLACLRTLVDDDTVRVIVWANEEPGKFSSGVDLDQLSSIDQNTLSEAARVNHMLITRMISSPKPIIAAMNGDAVGGGFELSLFCDIRFLADGARVGLPEVAIGFIPPIGGTQMLPRLVGRAKATELLFEGRLISAREALELGIVTRVYPSAELLQEAKGYARLLATKPPLALAGIRRCINAATLGDLSDNLAVEAAEVARVAPSEDLQEGIAAFLEKRPPDFRGK